MFACDQGWNCRGEGLNPPVRVYRRSFLSEIGLKFKADFQTFRQLTPQFFQVNSNTACDWCTEKAASLWTLPPTLRLLWMTRSLPVSCLPFYATWCWTVMFSWSTECSTGLPWTWSLKAGSRTWTVASSAPTTWPRVCWLFYQLAF